MYMSVCLTTESYQQMKCWQDARSKKHKNIHVHVWSTSWWITSWWLSSLPIFLTRRMAASSRLPLLGWTRIDSAHVPQWHSGPLRLWVQLQHSPQRQINMPSMALAQLLNFTLLTFSNSWAIFNWAVSDAWYSILNSSHKFTASRTTHTIQHWCMGKSILRHDEYSEPPAKYRKEQANQPQVETGPSCNGGGL